MWKSRKGEREEKNAEIYADELFSLIQTIARDKKLLKAFFQDILTPAEYREIGMRWQIVKRLSNGEPQRKVAQELGVSIATVTRGSRELLDKKGGFQKTLDKISKK